MREEQFKMERKGLVEEGQEVQVTERVNGEPLQLYCRTIGCDVWNLPQ